MLNLLTTQPLPVQITLSVLIGYLFGSSNMAYYLGRLKGVNLKEAGSGNLGASNAMVVLGKRAAVLTAAHDILKAVAAIHLVFCLFPGKSLIGFAAGTSTVLGHMYPFYLRFRGGKGFASFLGMILAMNWRLFLMMLVTVAIVTVLSDYIVFGTFTVILVYPLYLLYQGRAEAACIVLIATVCMLWKHRENIARLRSGEEIGLRRTLKGKDRVRYNKLKSRSQCFCFFFLLSKQYKTFLLKQSPRAC